MDPLIFLDIDGVVTSCMTTPGSYMNHEPSDYGPSPDCVERLKRLCDVTNAKIVISSNWRKFETIAQKRKFNATASCSRIAHISGKLHEIRNERSQSRF